MQELGNIEVLVVWEAGDFGKLLDLEQNNLAKVNHVVSKPLRFVILVQEITIQMRSTKYF